MIFLTVQRGLNTFATGTGDPNPYVLLCKYLVGAVFSDDVWTKAGTWRKSGRTEDDQKRANRNEHSQADKEPKDPGKELVGIEHHSLEPPKPSRPEPQD